MKVAMKTGWIALVFFVFSLCATSAFARSAPLINRENLAVTTGSGKAPTLEQVKHSILVAASVHNWQISEGTDGKLTATLLVRGKHSVVVSIPYTATEYSLIYKDSVNMNYDASSGTPQIHPNYNRWVDRFAEDICLELLKL